MDPLIVWIAAAALATLFAQAALAKFTDPTLFEQHLAAYGVPAALRGMATRLLPALEAAAALMLLVAPLRAAGAALAALLLLAYAAAMGWHRAQGHALDCGCGGEALPLSWTLVLRNAMLAGGAALAAAPMTDRALALGDFAVIAATLVLGTLLYAALHQVLRHRAGLRERTAFRRS